MPPSRTCSSPSPAGSCAMRNHPIFQLTLSRVREFYREPEAIFWVFGFPIVLAAALGLAFRNKGPSAISVGVRSGAGDRKSTRLNSSHVEISYAVFCLKKKKKKK